MAILLNRNQPFPEAVWIGMDCADARKMTNILRNIHISEKHSISSSVVCVLPALAERVASLTVPNWCALEYLTALTQTLQNMGLL